jgi:hypothetical protein
VATCGFLDAGTENIHCHHLAFHSPFACPWGEDSGGKTPGFELLASTGVDMTSDITITTNAMLLFKDFMLTFKTVSLLFTTVKFLKPEMCVQLAPLSKRSEILLYLFSL